MKNEISTEQVPSNRTNPKVDEFIRNEKKWQEEIQEIENVRSRQWVDRGIQVG